MLPFNNKMHLRLHTRIQFNSNLLVNSQIKIFLPINTV